MKKMKFYLKRLYVLMFGLFTLTCFHSCNKLETLDWTTWESDYFEVEYNNPLLQPHLYLDEELILRGKMLISFEEDGCGIIYIKEFELFDKKNNITYSNTDYYQYTKYTYDGKNVTLELFPTGSFFSGQIWTGKANEKTMRLSFIFGETITFRKTSKGIYFC